MSDAIAPSASARPAGARRVFLGLTAAALRRTTKDRLLGPAWWLLDALILLGVYAVVFGIVLDAREGPEGRDYVLFLASALIPWRLFALATQLGASAFLRNSALLTSIPVSRHAVVLSELASALVQAAAGFVVLAGFMAASARPVTAQLAWLPLPVLVMVALAAGAAYALCPLMALFPDAANAWAAVLRIGWFASPGVFSLARLPAEVVPWYAAFNPFVGILEGIRRPIHDGLPPLWGALGWSALWAAAVLAAGLWIFRRLAAAAVRML